MPDCCERGASFAGLGRMCDDLEAIPDIAPEDHGICMVIMKSCCANSLGPVLCERALNHRMNVGSCQTMSNDTCFSAGRVSGFKNGGLKVFLKHFQINVRELYLEVY